MKDLFEFVDENINEIAEKLEVEFIADLDQDQEFDGNILTGSNDPDGNLDPDTIIITDPNDISNFGTITTPLVIPGVGEYTITNTGSINFDPEPTYTGDASILFRVGPITGSSCIDTS